MINGPEEFAVRLVCDIRQALVVQAQKAQVVLNCYPAEITQQLAHCPLFNPEVGALYMVANCHEVRREKFNFSVELEFREREGSDDHETASHDVVVSVNGGPEMNVEEFAQKWQR